MTTGEGIFFGLILGASIHFLPYILLRLWKRHQWRKYNFCKICGRVVGDPCQVDGKLACISCWSDKRDFGCDGR